MLAAAVLACELAGLSWSAIHLSKLRIVAKRPGLIGSTGVSNLARACVVSIVKRGPARRATQLECQQARVARRGSNAAKIACAQKRISQAGSI